MGIASMGLRGDGGHAVMLVYNKDANELEYYDSNGSGAIYHVSGVAEMDHICAYLDRNLRHLQRNVSQPALQYWCDKTLKQQEAGSCALWASIAGIFRMCGVEKEEITDSAGVMLQISKQYRDALGNLAIQRYKDFPFEPLKEVLEEMPGQVMQIRQSPPLYTVSQGQEFKYVDDMFPDGKPTSELDRATRKTHEAHVLLPPLVKVDVALEAAAPYYAAPDLEKVKSAVKNKKNREKLVEVLHLHPIVEVQFSVEQSAPVLMLRYHKVPPQPLREALVAKKLHDWPKTGHGFTVHGNLAYTTYRLA